LQETKKEVATYISISNDGFKLGEKESKFDNKYEEKRLIKERRMNKSLIKKIADLHPPVVPIRTKRTSLFKQELLDDYSWLKAANWQNVLSDPDTLPQNIRDYLDGENIFTESVLSDYSLLRNQLQTEMRGRMKEDDSSVPERDGLFSYYTRFVQDGQHGLFCRTDHQLKTETVLLDADSESQGLPFFDLGEVAPSPDHEMLAWSADLTGSEYYTIRIRDIDQGKDRAVAISQTSGDMVWIEDNSGFYYIELDDKHRPVRVKRHLLGTPVESDLVVYEEQDPGFFIDISGTQSRSFIVIAASDHETSEAWLLNAYDNHATPRLVVKRQVGLQYEVEHLDDNLIILTNADGAEDFKIVTAPLDNPEKSLWRDLVAHRPGVMILSILPFSGHLARLERQDAKPRIIIRDMRTSLEHSIDFDDDAYALGMETGREFDTVTLRFRYSSMRTPHEIYDYNMADRSRILRKRQEVPSGHNPDDYEVARLFATAPDGEMVPISLIHRRNLVRDGSSPCLLYGYGSYGHAIPAAFKTNPLSLVDRGFVYAIAHVRGGTEKGWNWYLDGKRDRKVNTFTDFIACAEKLIELGYTSSKAIVTHGASAGGMLMGAVANMAPDLFGGIIAEVPFVDVLNTMLDADLPLTPPEWPEWGNPAASEDEFRTILSYSPYDNIKAQAYPPILALGGLTDPRVTYWEPAKWVAKIRAHMTGGGPVLLHTNMDAGHGGASGRFDRLEEVALVYAFAIATVLKE